MMKYPEDWKMVKLGEIGQPLMCKRILKGQTSAIGDVPFYKIGTFGKDADAFISQDLYEEYKSKYSYPTRGTVLISAAGTIGRLVVFDGKDAYFQDSNIVWIDNDESIALNEYLFWTFKKIKWQTEDGGVISRLYNDNLCAMQIPLPSLAEQKRIAEVLGNADQLINNLEKRIAKKCAIKQGAIQELLTGKKRLPGFTGEWKMVKLGKLSTIKARIGWQGLTTAEYLTDGEYYLVNGINIEAGKVIWRKCFMVDKKRYNQDKNIQLRKHDVLVSKDGTIGKVAYVTNLPKLATLNSGVFVIRTTDSTILQEYLARIFLSKWFDNFVKKITAGSTIVHLYQKDIVGFSFMVPPTIAEQRAIAKILSDMDDGISILERKLEKVKAVKQGMMQDLLTGKVRLRGQA